MSYRRTKFGVYFSMISRVIDFFLKNACANLPNCNAYFIDSPTCYNIFQSFLGSRKQ